MANQPQDERGVAFPAGPQHAAPQAASDAIEVSQLLEALRRHTRLILLVGAVTLVLVMALTAVSRMTFVSAGRLYLGELGAEGRAGAEDIQLSAAGHSDLGSEVEILTSQTIIKRAILASGLNVDINPPEWTPPRYWRWRLEQRNPEMLDAGYRKLVAVNTLLEKTALEGAFFEAVFDDARTYRLLDAEGQYLATGKLGVPLSISGILMTLQPGPDAAPGSGERFEVYVRPLDEVADEVREALSVTPPAEPTAKVVTLAYQNGSPRRSAALLRALMDVYLEIRQSWKTENAQAAEEFVRKQLERMQSSLDNTQEKLANFRSENDVVVTESEAEAMVQQVGRYEEQRVHAKLLVSHLRTVRNALRKKNPPVEAFMFGEADDAVLKGMAESLSEAQRGLVELRGKFKEAAPDVQQQQQQVDAQLRMIRNYVKSRLSRAQAQLSELNRIIAQYREKLRTVPGAEAGLAQIGRESEVYSKMYSYLLQQQQETAMLTASTLSKNRILDAPQVPLYEDSPTLGMRLLSGVLGMLLAALYVIARMLVTPALRSDSEAEWIASRVPVFARLPGERLIPTPKKRRRASGTGGPFDLLSKHEYFAFAEGIRTLRTNLYHACGGESSKVVLFTSPAAGDGKTTCCLSLAAMLATDSKHVLVIDGDLRKPSHHELTNTPLRPGLSGVLAGEQNWKSAIRTVDTSLGSFDVLSAGTGASIELLSSPQLTSFLINARARYDFVIMDCAGFPMVSDALVLGHQADFVVSVVRLRSTPRRWAEEHFHGLAGFAPAHAVVVNNSDTANVRRYPYPIHQPRFPTFEGATANVRFRNEGGGGRNELN